VSLLFAIGRRAVPLVAAASFVAACSDGPTSPQLHPQLGSAGSRSGGAGTPNVQKYRDSGIKPATGRSGAAAITAIAAANLTGQTLLEVRSFRNGDLTAPLGSIVKLQVKAFAPSGQLLFTTTYNNLAANPFTASYTGLVPGVTFQVQANVRGIDGRRTDVVTAVGVPLVRAPDVAVTGVTAPVSALAGMPTVVSATVAELNGDLGARADCVLYVDGAEADRAGGIWVDAGDVVSCAFTTTFTTVGNRALDVRAETVSPADYNRSNNAASASVQVIAPSTSPTAPAVSYSASASDLVFTVRDSFMTRWTFVPSGQLFQLIESDRDESGRMQEAAFNATIGTAVGFPLTRVELAQASGGRLLHSARYDDLAADPGSGSGASCVVRGLGTGVEFYMCAHRIGFTALTYLRHAGTVTYLSFDYTSFWNGATYDEDTYVDNGSITVGTVVPFGPTYTFDVKVTDGSTLYALGAEVPLGPVATSDIEPEQCDTFRATIPPSTYDAYTCVSFSYIAAGVGGAASGAGAVGQLATTP